MLLYAAFGWLLMAVRVIKLSPVGLLVAVWRTFVALGAMALIVGLVSTSFGDYTNQWLPVVLASEIIAGALAFIGTHLGLWVLSGSPNGPERQALDVVAAKLGRKVESPAA